MDYMDRKRAEMVDGEWETNRIICGPNRIIEARVMEYLGQRGRITYWRNPHTGQTYGVWTHKRYTNEVWIHRHPVELKRGRITNSSANGPGRDELLQTQTHTPVEGFPTRIRHQWALANRLGVVAYPGGEPFPSHEAMRALCTDQEWERVQQQNPRYAPPKVLPPLPPWEKDTP